MAAYWEIAAHLAYDMFSKYLIVNLVFSRFGFSSGYFLSNCAISLSLHTCTFMYDKRFFASDRAKMAFLPPLRWCHYSAVVFCLV